MENSKNHNKDTGRRAGGNKKYHLKLYISGSAPRSMSAVNHITEICKNLGGCDLQIIDIYENPGLAKEDQIIAIPTLIKLSPAPERRIIGDLADREKVMSVLNHG
jgi:circadian clock protein KaiB